MRNHAAGIPSVDLFVVQTISFKLLYGLVILGHARRRLVSVSVTSNPTAEWIAGQVTDSFPSNEAPPSDPRLRRRIRSSVHPTHWCNGYPRSPAAPRSPWENGHLERLIGSMRRESLDHLIAFGEAHFRNILESLRVVLQQCPAPSLTGQRCSRFSDNPEDRASSQPFLPSAVSIINTSGLGFH